MLKRGEVFLLRCLGVLSSLAIIIGLAWFFIYKPAPVAKQLEVHFLDVGQGDAILAITPSGQNILIDGGPDKNILSRLSKFLPWWDRQIDLMILTHPHDDHVAGQISVLQRYKVKQVLMTGVSHTAPNYLEFLRLIKEKNIPVKIINQAQIIKVGEVDLNILYPDRSFYNQKITNLNNSSIVLKLVYGNNSFLLAGDAEKEVEEILVAKKVDLKADVFKLSHHGSTTANSEEFVQEIKPEFSIITCGKDNAFGHPHLRTVKRFERLNYKYWRTDLQGNISFFSDGNKIEIKL